MKRRSHSITRPICEINLTSMMDLTFLLLITFVITFPLVEQGMSVNLPHGKSREIDASDKPAVVTVDKQGRVYLSSAIVSMETLEAKLLEMFEANHNLKLVIRGDKDVNYGAVVEVARLATKIGIQKMTLATQE